jgi:hypothetical protein
VGGVSWSLFDGIFVSIVAAAAVTRKYKIRSQPAPTRASNDQSKACYKLDSVAATTTFHTRPISTRFVFHDVHVHHRYYYHHYHYW